MPSATNRDVVSRSLLEFVTDGKYPDSEDIAAAKFGPSFLPKGLQDISQARAQVEDEINSLSRNTASDVDGWMSQARQLRADIERSRVTARDIVAQHERTQPLEFKVKDASAKVQLITTEIAFNEAVTAVFQEVHKFSAYISNGLKAVEEEQINDSIASLEAAEKFLESQSLRKYDNIISIFHERVAFLRKSIADLLLSCWSRQVRVDKNELEVRDNDEPEQFQLLSLVKSLSRLDVFDTVNTSFQNRLLEDIFQPVLMPSNLGESREVSVGEHGVLIGASRSSSIPDVLCRLVSILRYLQEKLPASISELTAEAIIPKISAIFCECWLNPSVPSNLDDIREFEDILVRVNEFATTIESFGWHGQEQLVSWINHFPRLWLTHRRVGSLDQVRRILVQSKVTTKEVERVEKEVVTNQDDVLLDTGVTEDWDANWGDENEEEEHSKPDASEKLQASKEQDEDDVDAWGLGEETDDIAKEADEDEVIDDAWGWGDDAEEEEKQEAAVKVEVSSKVKIGGRDHPEKKKSPAQEIVLKENYTITDIPDSIISLIKQQVSDSESLSNQEFSTSRVAASGNGLLALPTLIIAMFKAIASSFYSLKLNAGNMYLYNDSLYLSEQVRKLVQEHQLTRLASDVEGLERFGKTSYSKEMQMQRTVATDLLDGSQGFVRCSEQPFLRECENAVEATVDRIRSVFKEWQPILSHSALLQSLGSLLSAVIHKMIVDIEDLSDISEAESQTLITLCNKLSALEDIFIPEVDVGAASMAAVYVRNWLKFQYLINILESSLADIKFLWVDGELGLEFSPDEVIDLITALFAESDHRRRTIADIRRTRQ